jgi:hypothetical protein
MNQFQTIEDYKKYCNEYLASTLRYIRCNLALDLTKACNSYCSETPFFKEGMIYTDKINSMLITKINGIIDCFDNMEINKQSSKKKKSKGKNRHNKKNKSVTHQVSVKKRTTLNIINDNMNTTLDETEIESITYVSEVESNYNSNNEEAYNNLYESEEKYEADNNFNQEEYITKNTNNDNKEVILYNNNRNSNGVHIPYSITSNYMEVSSSTQTYNGNRITQRTNIETTQIPIITERERNRIKFIASKFIKYNNR